ncbi:MAG: transposase [Pseudobdellovibrionaceae bacterium]|nr:transposase [Pseudobdellovibrionaceae bacterium]
MHKHLNRIIQEFDLFPKALVNVVSAYILYLMLETRGHNAKQASALMGVPESSFSRMLNRPDSLVLAKGNLNRSARRRLNALRSGKKGKRPLVIIDSTLTGRRGKYVENVSFHRLGKKSVRGHKLINFVLYLDGEIIPLSVLAHYSQEYCENNGYTYKTENELVIEWLNWLHASNLFAKDDIKHLHFVCDAGYDAKKVQKAINRIGCHFTMCIKSSRLIEGLSIEEYFCRQRIIPWQSIRLFAEKDGKKMRKEYRIKISPNVQLKGFGLVSAVYSEAKKRDGSKSKKYIVSSNTRLSGREIVEIYRDRWAIESWHKDMKQNHGYGDCRSTCFRAFEAHVNLCLAAYNLQRCNECGIPKPGTSIIEYIGVRKLQDGAQTINQFNGVQRFKRAASEALAEMTIRKVA